MVQNSWGTQNRNFRQDKAAGRANLTRFHARWTNSPTIAQTGGHNALFTGTTTSISATVNSPTENARPSFIVIQNAL